MRSTRRIAIINLTRSRSGFMILFGAIIATGLLKRPRPKSSARTKRVRNAHWLQWISCSRLSCGCFILLCRISLKSCGRYWALERLDSICRPATKDGAGRCSRCSRQTRLVSAIYQTVQAGRNLRAESKLPSNRKIGFILRTNEKLISEQIPTLTRLLNAEEVTLDPKYQAPAGTPVAVTPLGEIFLADRCRGPEHANESDWTRKSRGLMKKREQLRQNCKTTRSLSELQRQWSRSIGNG